MSQLRFKIYNQIITRVDNFIPVDGSKNYLHAEFDFETNEWAGLTKTAQFRRGEGETVYEVILQNDACEVPHEVLKNNGTRRVLVTVFAGSLVTANSAEVFMTPTGYDDDAESSEPPTPSVYEQIIELMENKVDKIPGKGLSTEDFTTADKTKLEGIEPGAEENVIDTIKVNGTELEPEDKAVDITVPTKTSQLDNDSDYVSDASYVHTDNNFTDADESKLDGIESGAEVNVNPDWEATSGDGEILHKPTTIDGYGISDAYTKTQTDGLLADKADASSVYTKSEVDTALAGKANASTVYTMTETNTLLAGKVDKVQGKGLSTEDFTTAEKNKLSGIEAGAEVNVNADWNADSGDAQILNKPQIYTKSEIDTALGNKADVSALTAHTSDKNNPHDVTAAQVPYGTSTVASALAEMAGDIADVQNVINLLYDTDFILNADNYKPMMQLWFTLRNADDMTPAELTALCDEWYTVTRRAWHGWVVFPSSGNSYATRYGDLVGVVVEPSTRETEARDDLKGNPLFATMDCNWTIDSTTKEPVITAIDGVTSGFVRDDPTVHVGVLQMSGYFYQSFDQNGDETNGYSSTHLEGYGMVPVKESIRPDGTVRPWVVHGKYMSGQRIENSTEYMTCCSGQKVKAYNKSHNTLHTMAPRSGTGFSGGTVVDWTWLEIMHRIVYACMASDPINAGCLSYNYTAYAQVAETDVKRILCTPSAVTSIEVGSCVLVGAVSSDNKSDRGVAACYSISGQLGAIVTGKENIEVGGVTYTAVYVDTDSTFTTAANGNGVAGTTLIMTFHWPTGALDNVKGHNGSIAANTSGKYPALLQGIEYMVGAYEVFADIIVKWIVRDGASVAEFYVVNDATDQASDVTADYVKVGELVPGSGSNNWYYISKMVYQNGVFVYASVAGGSSSTFTRDQTYIYKDGTTTGLREWRAFCILNYGVARGGLSASYLGYGLGSAYWSIAARLSPNGTRGELTA